MSATDTVTGADLEAFFSGTLTAAGVATEARSRSAAGAWSASRTAVAPWAGTPSVSTRPEAAAMTAAWRPTEPALEETALEIDSNGLVRTGVARCRPRA